MTRSARLIAVSPAMSRELLRIGIRADRVEVIPNGVAPLPSTSEDDRSVLTHLYAGEGRNGVVLFVGRLTKVKRVALLLHAWAATPSRAHAVLLIVGDGPLRHNLEATAETLGLRDSVRFVGMQAEVLPFYQAADVFVLPSASEGMSNALLEAMAAGLPVVVSDIPANREVVQDGRNGFLVHWTDSAHCARILQTILEDPELRRRVGGAARERATRFSIGAVADRYCQLYRGMLHRHVGSAE
jgi:glycosyltransferase involved in cell wall biosynthesis